MKRVLIGGPVRQRPNILKEFLKSLEEVDKSDLEVDYFFVDDNNDSKSSDLLEKFSKKYNMILKKAKDYAFLSTSDYVCDDKSTHIWKKDLIKKITLFKNDIIDYARVQKYDYLFFIDSDIVLNRQTIKHLMSRKVDIVSNVFWTQWYTGMPLEPQVWLQDVWSCFINDWDNPLNKNGKVRQKLNFFTKLRFPGIYEVGGLGACTLISKNALAKGVSFALLDNISFWGEDRHFCVRAKALGLKLYVDTVYPAYHIYREEYLNRVDEFKKEGFKFDMCQTNGKVKGLKGKLGFLKKRIIEELKFYIRSRQKAKFEKKRVKNNNKIVLSMTVHNESGRYLESVLKQAAKCVDEVVIIDDASTDNTVEICEEILKNIPHRIIKNKKSMFKNEYKLRTKQWKETLKQKPGWILNLDADEVLEDGFEKMIREIVKIDYVDLYNFKLFDMWNETEYRDDNLWNAHTRYMPFMVRYQPKFKYKFKKSKQHCGRLPKNIYRLTGIDFDLRIKHFGWAREEDRKSKYERYMKLDKDGKCGSLEQYKSILDKNPNLKKFEDGK